MEPNNQHNPDCFRGNQTIVCRDSDCELALEITLWLLQYSLKVYELLHEYFLEVRKVQR